MMAEPHVAGAFERRECGTLGVVLVAGDAGDEHQRYLVAAGESQQRTRHRAELLALVAAALVATGLELLSLNNLSLGLAEAGPRRG